MDFQVDTSQITAWSGRMKGAGPVIHDETTTAMQRSVLALQGGMMQETPVLSGNLRRGWTSEVSAGGGVIKGVVGNNVPYGPIVYRGRGPIVARGRALRFVIKGKVLFRKRVGPAKANRFVDRAWNKTVPRIIHEFEQVIPRAAKRLGL